MGGGALTAMQRAALQRRADIARHHRCFVRNAGSGTPAGRNTCPPPSLRRSYGGRGPAQRTARPDVATLDAFPDRGLRPDRRLRDGGPGGARRLDRLAVLAALRFGRLLRRPARRAGARPLATGAGRPTAAASTRRYLGDTLILETRFETDQGTAKLIDFMPPRSGHPDCVRLVVGESGSVAMHMQLAVRFGYGSRVPWIEPAGRRHAAHHRRRRPGRAAHAACR